MDPRTSDSTDARWTGFLLESLVSLGAMTIAAPVGYWAAGPFLESMARDLTGGELVMSSPTEPLEVAIGLAIASGLPWLLSWLLDLGHRLFFGRGPRGIDRILVMAGPATFAAIGMALHALWIREALSADMGSLGGVTPYVSVASLGLHAPGIRWALGGTVLIAVIVFVRARRAKTRA